jgi:glutamyl-tRNA reductase
VEISNLSVLHWRGQHPPGTPVPEVLTRDAFLIETCQRWVSIAQHRFPASDAEAFDGTDAYAFLLRFACGLESKLVAETEIFGQIKQAWQQFSSVPSALSRQLSPWMQLLFQDAKAIRSQYLAKLGSASYGSQVRRLLGEDSGVGPTLLIGAGQLAQSIAPWLVGTDLWLWNRTQERAAELARELSKRCTRSTVRVIDASLTAELDAWRSCANVIVCVPADAARDAQRIAAWGERPESAGRLVHLGLKSGADTPWAQVPGLVSLGALFDMLHAQTEQRRQQIERARRACAEKAVLRSLGASAMRPHSWEDLAAFDSL